MDAGMDGPHGSISTTETREATVVHLSGAIDVALRADAGAAMSRSLERRLPVVLDTSEVTFVDSYGIAFLIQCTRWAHEEGLTVTLPSPSPHVSTLLRRASLEGLFDEADGRRDADRAGEDDDSGTGQAADDVGGLVTSG